MSFGTLSYNGYTFGPLTNTSANGTPVYDESGRTITHIRWVFTAEGIAAAVLAGDVDANEHFARIRSKLSDPGGVFEIADKGFGGLVVNSTAAGSVNDLQNGPKPQILTWKPIGHENAVEFSWSCEVNVAECDNQALFGVSAFNYETTYSINDRGFTVRTVSGYLEVIAAKSGNQWEETADEYRDEIKVTPIPDCKRSQTYSLSKDKRRLSFTITDTPIESANAFPPGVTDIKGRHRARINGRDRARIDTSINVTIELSHGEPRSLAWETFRAIWQTRIAVPVGLGHVVMLEHLDLDEDLFGIKYSFTGGYRVITDDIAKVVQNLGLFTPLGYDWADWKDSIEAIEDNRGLAGHETDATEDKVVNVCDQETPQIGGDNQPLPIPASTMQGICNTTPAPADSYVHFEATLTEVTTYAKAYAVELGEVTGDTLAFDASITDAELAPVDGLYALEKTVAEAAPSMLWRFKGYAERLGYKMPVPDLISVDGIEFEKVGQNKFAQQSKGLHYCVPLYSAAWDLLYRVRERPSVEDTEDINPNYTG